MRALRALCLLAYLLAATSLAVAQSVLLEGLRVGNHQGSFGAARYAADGTLWLLYDGGDGLQLLHSDARVGKLLGQVTVGSSGDHGVEMALDPAGNIYVVGTSGSGNLSGTPGAVYPAAADLSTNSFLAKFDPELHLQFLTFLGAGRTAVTGVAATADAVFVTGTTYNASFPVTATAVEPQPAPGSAANGFAERFSTDGSALVYSTLLTGAEGDTNPLAIAADASDNVYLAGETSSASLPAKLALEPTLSGSTSGFVARLAPAGDAFSFLTYIPGAGLTGADFDTVTGTLLLSGTVAPGQFPIATVASPIANETQQSLLRLSADGQTVLASALLLPGTASRVRAGPAGTAWVSGTMGTPLADEGDPGDSFLLHVTDDGTVDTLRRFGGFPLTNATLATLTSTVGAPAVSGDGITAVLPGTLYASAKATIASQQHFAFVQTGDRSEVVPGSIADVLATSCPGSSECDGSAGLLAIVSTRPGASFAIFPGNLPTLSLRNSGSLPVELPTIVTSGYTAQSSCATEIPSGAECGVVLGGGGPGTLTIMASNTPGFASGITSTTALATGLVLNTSELDFGIVTAGSSPVARTVTITDLGSVPVSFPSAADGLPPAAPYTLSELTSTCGGDARAHLIGAGARCTVTLGLAARSSPASDGPVRTGWTLGDHDIAVTGVAQAAALSLSSAAVDFGARFSDRLGTTPRYLYLSNMSAASVPHTEVQLPSGSPFQVTDHCPSMLEPESVCQLMFTYSPTGAPEVDNVTVELDAGLSVFVMGTVLSRSSDAPGGGSTLSVAPLRLDFPTAVAVTALSATPSILSVTNTGSAPVQLQAEVTGDFRVDQGCGGSLAPGATCLLAVTFAPRLGGPREGLLTLVAANGSLPAVIPLSGTGVDLLATDNGRLALGATLVGEPVIAWYKLLAPVPALTASVTGSAFRIAVVPDLGYGHGTLPASAFAPAATGNCLTCWLGVAFTPQLVGPADGKVTLTGNAGGNPFQVMLAGSGLPYTGLILTPGQPDLGTVPVGSTSAPLSFTLLNLLLPAATVNVQNVSITGDFQILPRVGTGAPCAGALAATAACYLQIAFTPTGPGRRTGTLTVLTDGGQVSVPLAGDAVSGGTLGMSPAALVFSNAWSTDGSASDPARRRVLTLSNHGEGALEVVSLAASDPSFVVSSDCDTLLPAASCAVDVQFVPQPSEVEATLAIGVIAHPGGDPNATAVTTYHVPLSASYTSDEAGLVLLPAAADFGVGAVGALGQTRQFTVTNTSSAAETVRLHAPQQFPFATPPNCGTLLPGESCTFAVAYLPVMGGAATGSIFAVATGQDGSTSEAIGYLQGYGDAKGQLEIAGLPAPGTPLNLGVVGSSQSVTAPLALKNVGAGPLTITRLQTSPPFAASTDCGAMLAPGEQCGVTLTYAPVFELPESATTLTPRAEAETLVIGSDTLSSPNVVDLEGTALPVVTAAPSESVAIGYTLSDGALSFPNTPAGQVSDAQTLTLHNGGSGTVLISAIVPSADFQVSSTCVSLEPGASCAVDVRFAPMQAGSGAFRAGTLSIQSNASDPLEFVSLLGLSETTPLQISPDLLDFGVIALRSEATQQVRITNVTTLPVTLGSVVVTGDYLLTPGSCANLGMLLGAGQTCTLSVRFLPSATGTRSGSLTLATNAATTPLTVQLTGVGAAPELQVTPGALAFGAVKLGATATLTLKLSNVGNAALQALQATIAGADTADFEIAQTCLQIPVAPSSGCTLAVAFHPKAVGSRSASLLLSSSDPAGPTSVVLTGTGLPASSFALTVNGGAAATESVEPGAAAAFPLLLTPKESFSGPVRLQCSAVAAGSYIACALPEATVNLNGAPTSMTANLTTAGPSRSTTVVPWTGFLLLPLAWSIRKTRRRGRFLLVVSVLLGAVSLAALEGCGGPGSRGEFVTPPGRYTYQVVATSVEDATLTSVVTLTVVIR